MPDNTVKVDRATIWGNPFRVGDVCESDGGEKCEVRDAAHAVALFREALERDGGYFGHAPRGRTVFVGVEDIRRELRRRNLACWCRLGAPCHADLLLALANSQER